MKIHAYDNSNNHGNLCYKREESLMWKEIEISK